MQREGPSREDEPVAHPGRAVEGEKQRHHRRQKQSHARRQPAAAEVLLQLPLAASSVRYTAARNANAMSTNRPTESGNGLSHGAT